MTSATGGGSGPTQWGRGARAALVVGCAAGYGLLAGVWTPRGPNDAVEALAAMALGLGVGLLAGAVMRSWWAMLVAPVAFVAVFELVRLDASGATIDSITLSSEYGVLAFIVGRVFHGILAVWPLLVGVALGRACARRRPGLDPSAGSWPVRVGGAFRRVAFVVSVAVLLVLAVALVRPASTDPVLDTDGEPLAGSIAELDTASIDAVLLAAIYGALFVYQAVLFVRAGVVGDRLRFSASNGAAGRFGWAAITYALVAPHVISPPVPDRPRATRRRCRQEPRDHAGDT